MVSSIETSTPVPLKEGKKDIIFDTTVLDEEQNLRKEFIWKNSEVVAEDEVIEPIIDLSCVEKGDEIGIAEAAKLMHAASSNHGFFQIRNHGVDLNLIKSTFDEIDNVFKLPLEKKNTVPGYSGAHAERYSSDLPWKETFSFHHQHQSQTSVVHSFKSSLGDHFESSGMVCQRYCNEMTRVGLIVMELLAIGLGVEKYHFRKFNEDGYAMVRYNYSPPCKNAALTFGTGPHRDPLFMTILSQDEVHGYELFTNDVWKSVKPLPDSLLINIGDTFMAFTNGIYKSCLHRAVVNREKRRRTMAFFMCPKSDNVVKPPEEVMIKEGKRQYPDFTWAEYYQFTQDTYRTAVDTFDKYLDWLHSNKTLKF